MSEKVKMQLEIMKKNGCNITKIGNEVWVTPRHNKRAILVTILPVRKEAM